MEEIKIEINEDEYLSDAFSRYFTKQRGASREEDKYIPSNTILNKTLPGLGATYSEIKAKRHSIIIEPNIPVILGKTAGKTNLLGVYTGVTEGAILQYLRNENIKYKKIITTPESYKKVKDAILKLPIFNLYKDFFVLFDECEKLVQDIDYRESICQPIDDLFMYTNKAFVSATPLEMSLPKFEEQGFYLIRIIPTYAYKKDIELIITNQYEVSLLKKMKELNDSDCICIFLNKTDSIDKIINHLKIKDQSNVFCSDKSVKKLKKLGYKDVYENIKLPLRKYNFFTCRFFSALDIYTNKKPDILILTCLKDANHTMIDPFTEAVQIYGRFRKLSKGQKTLPFNSITCLADFNPDFEIKNKENIDLIIDTYQSQYRDLKHKIDSVTNQYEEEACCDDLKKLSYNDFMTEKGELNHLAVNNLYSAERVKGYYLSPDSLVNAYKSTEHFNIVKQTIINDSFTLDGQWFRKSKRPIKEIRKGIISSLDGFYQNSKDSEVDIKTLKDVLQRVEVSDSESGEFMVEAYEYLGREEIERIGYSATRVLKTAVNHAKAEYKQKLLFTDIMNDLKLNFAIESRPSKKDLVNYFAKIYKLYGIDIRVSQETIKHYCEVKSHNSKIPACFRITSYNSEFREDIKT